MGNSISMNNWQFSMPMYQTWNNNFGFNNGMFSNPWTSFSTSTSSAADDESFEAWEKRQKQEVEEAQKKYAEQLELSKLRTEKDKQIQVLDKSMQIEEVREQKTQLENNKKADGSTSVKVSNKKLGFWGKAGRWLSNAGTSIVNMGKQFVGIEKDGSWNWTKCLKNVGIAAAAVGACFIPVVGPAIGYALAASGVAMGAVGVVKGVNKLSKAKTDEEIDKAQQEICGGAFIGITSACGLRGIGRGAAGASTATSRTSLAGRVVQKTSQFGRDMTVNAWKATVQAMKADKAALAGGGVSGFFKQWGSKITSSYQSFNDHNQRYDKQRTQLNNSVDEKLAKVNSEINQIKNLGNTNGRLTTPEQQRLALLKEEKYLLERNKMELNNYFGTNTREKSLYDKLSKDNSGVKAGNRISNRNQSSTPNRVQRCDIPKEQLNNFYARILREQKQYSKSLKSLIKAKECAMRQMAKKGENIASLDKYVPVRDVKKSWYKPSTWKQNEYQLAIGGKNPGNYKELLGLTLTTPASTVPKAIYTIDPLYSTPFMYGNDLTAEQTTAAIEELEASIQSYEEMKKAIESIKTPEEWNAFVSAQQKAQQEAQEQPETEQKS